MAAALAATLYLGPLAAAGSASTAASVTVVAAPGSITANGSMTSTVTATVVDANNNPVPGDSIQFTSSLGGTAFAAATGTTNSAGQYATTITGTQAGVATIQATDTSAGTLNGTAPLTLTAGPAATVTVGLAPTSIPADGSTTSTVTATVVDANNNPVPNDSIQFSSTHSGISFTNATGTTNASGQYATTITGTKAGSATITATDSTAGGLNNSASLTLTAGPASSVTVTAVPGSITANGSMTSTVTATVVDANNNPVPGDSIQFTSSLGGTAFAAATGTTNSAGQYQTTITGTQAGSATITATDSTAGGLNNTTSLTLTAGAAASLAVTLSQNPIAANGATSSTVTAKVLDAHGNPVQGNSIHLTSSLAGTTIAAPTGITNSSGQYSSTITATKAGITTITATDTTAGAGGLNNSAQLTIVNAQPQNIGLTPLGSLTANGSSSTTETATVTDSHGNPVPNQSLTFSASPAGVGFNPVTGSTNSQGKLTVTITSSTVAGAVTVTATDVTPGSAALPASTQLTLAPGPATTVDVSLSPASIVANGASSTTATATVIDVNGNAIPSDSISFSSTDPGDLAGSTTGHGDGTYTATIRSSTTVGTPTITATDNSVNGVSGQATLTQTAAGSTVALSASPRHAVTNQPVTLAATVQTASGAPAGVVSFDAGASAISACTDLPVTVSGSVGAAACVTSFAAGSPPGPLTAVYTPSTSVSLGSTSAAVSLVLTAAPTTTKLSQPSTTKVGAQASYGASVTTSSPGAVAPGGVVTFLDGSTAIAKCSKVPLTSGVAGCALSYRKPGPHVITARYVGDVNFVASDSSPGKMLVLPAKKKRLLSVTSTMTWSFLRTKAYSEVISLVISHPPAGGAVVIKCSGHGCPFARRTVTVPSHTTCTKGRHRHCTTRAARVFDITSQVHGAKLAPGAMLVIELTRKGYNGKYYEFKITGTGPQSHIACIAPNHKKPNQGCRLH